MCTPATVRTAGAEPLGADESQRYCREIESILGGYKPNRALIARLEGRGPAFQLMTLVMAKAYDEINLMRALEAGVRMN